MSQQVQEIERALYYTKKACVATANAESGEELRVAWENFVDNYGKTIDRLISVGLAQASTKGWAYRLKHNSTKQDEGLIYMREARNCSQHAPCPIGHFQDPKTTLGNFISLEGVNRDITFENITENGKNIVGSRIAFDQSGGTVSNMRGDRPESLQELPASVRLGPIFNPEKQKTANFPSSICGRPVTSGSPRSLARAAMDALEEIVNQFKKELG